MENNHKVDVKVIARNILGTTAEVKVGIVVKRSETVISSTMVDELLTETDKDVKLANLGQVSSLSTSGKEEVDLSTRMGNCRECSPTNAKCGADTNYRCVCSTGYAPPFCRYSTEAAEENKKIMRTVAANIGTMLAGASDKEEKLALLNSAEVCSEGSTLADKIGNQEIEKVEKKLVAEFESGGLDTRESMASMFKLLSQTMGGVDAEREERHGENKEDKDQTQEEKDDQKELDTRANERMSNLKKVLKKLMKEQGIGTKMEQQKTDNFDLTGMVNKADLLAGSELQTDDGPKVKLPAGLGGATADRLVIVNYIHVKIIRHITLERVPLSNTVDVELNDYETGDNVPVTGLTDPIEIEFVANEVSDEAVEEEVEKEGETVIMRPKCVFYDETKEDYSYEAVDTVTGDIVVGSQRTFTCKCHHMTEFTVAKYEDEDSKQNIHSDYACGLTLPVVITLAGTLAYLF